MGERTHGLHRLVTFSGLYLTIQRLLAGPNAHQRVADFGDPQFRDSIGPFEVVIGMGILHHLDDSVVQKAAANLATLLGLQGRHIGVEPVLHDHRKIPVPGF